MVTVAHLYRITTQRMNEDAHEVVGEETYKACIVCRINKDIHGDIGLFH